MRVIPAIDLKDGRCVRLFQGDYKQQTEYSKDPAAIARRFSGLAVTDLHIVDLDGALTGEPRNSQLVRDIAAESGLTLQLGGGLRDRGLLADWYAAGVSRCVIGSMAVREPQTVLGWFKDFGGERLVLALDVALDAQGTPVLATDGWTRTSDTVLWDCIDTFLAAGLVHLLCTDISRDGALSGPNIELYREIMRRYPMMQLQASGGVRDAGDLRELAEAGIPAAITGRALLDGRISDDEVASFLPAA